MFNYQCQTCGQCSSSLKLARDHKWCTNHGKFIKRSIEDIANEIMSKAMDRTWANFKQIVKV